MLNIAGGIEGKEKHRGYLSTEQQLLLVWLVHTYTSTSTSANTHED